MRFLAIIALATLLSAAPGAAPADFRSAAIPRTATTVFVPKENF